MKKFLKVSLVIMSIVLLLLCNYCYATNNITESDISNVIPEEWARDLDTNVSSEDMLIDEAFEKLYNTNEEAGIMPINLTADVIDNDIYLFQESISIEGDVNGNIYVMGKNINISSDYLNGNVFAIGQDVVIKGKISGSVYVIGENVNIEAESVDTVYALGEKVNLAENANVMQDLKVSTSQLNLSGNINRELDAYVEDINITEKSEYICKGNVSYSGSISDPNGVLETVNVTKHEEVEEKVENAKKLVVVDKIKSEIVTIISTIIIIGVIYLIIRNKQIEKIENYPHEILTNILSGLLWIILVPFLSFILICTIIGIPLAILALIVYIVGLFISVPVASLRISEVINNNKPTQNKISILLYAICVYVAIELVSLIPVIGGLVKFLVVLYGFECLIKYIFPSKNKNSKKEEEVIINE